VPHYRAGLGRVARIGPNRVIDVETTAALLVKPGDAERRLLGAPAPHAEAAKTARIAHRVGVLALPIGACRIGHLRCSLSVKAFADHMPASSRFLAPARAGHPSNA
jgi:hypothetical protein